MTARRYQNRQHTAESGRIIQDLPRSAAAGAVAASEVAVDGEPVLADVTVLNGEDDVAVDEMMAGYADVRNN